MIRNVFDRGHKFENQRHFDVGAFAGDIDIGVLDGKIGPVLFLVPIELDRHFLKRKRFFRPRYQPAPACNNLFEDIGWQS